MLYKSLENNYTINKIIRWIKSKVKYQKKKKENDIKKTSETIIQGN